jgi:uracil phosphoribosyltransferase
MPVYNLSQSSSLLSVYLTELRDVTIQGDRMRFRRNLERIGEIMAYEISKHIQPVRIQTQTPLGVATTDVPGETPILATILRAGLPFHQGFLNYYDKADNAFLSAWRKHDTENRFHIELSYVASADFHQKTLIVCDPMLATGQSMVTTLQALFENGVPGALHIACVVASEQGITHVATAFPDAHIWAAGIDPELNKSAYIVPGLGDAGDLAFGRKLQQ